MDEDHADSAAPAGGVQVTMETLPEELLSHILSFLSLPEQLKVASVSRQWHQCVIGCLARYRCFTMDLIPIPAFWYYTNERLERVLSHLPGLRRLENVKCQNVGDDLMWFFNIEPAGLLDADILCRHCPLLVEANLRGFKLDVPALERLCLGCPGLEEVTLPAACDEACVEVVLRGLPKLKTLNIDLKKLTGKFLSLLPANLERLEMRGVFKLLEEELERAPSYTTLEELDITGLKNASCPALVKLLSVCPQLMMLDAYGSGITDAFLEQLPVKIPGLRVLHISGCEGLSEAGLLNLARLKELRWLDLFDTNTTDAVLRGLLSATRLSFLAVGSHCDRPIQSTEDVLCDLVLALPSLREVRLSRGIWINDVISFLNGRLPHHRNVTLSLPTSATSKLYDEPEEGDPLRLEIYPD
ncbi:F-box/LRR-repeat protein 20-like isoform X2 [Amphibalanus amphitrite]|uniref:F-box/LRR-repeat protein 20-like isoform X2 n=1 Tax=Amphibalanus amphitrite TaxID=1232801 RepID=UPI001C9126FA|nr:F-box/LRR-repeat protein 20-like isoform X2 [Amphibalanus amphitrite]